MKSYILQCKNNRVFFSFFFGLLFFIICQTSPLGENLKSLCVEVLYFNKSHGRSPPNVMEGSDFSFFYHLCPFQSPAVLQEIVMPFRVQIYQAE